MSSPKPQLDVLRQQIDGLDDRIHDLLIERSAMIEQIIAAKGDGQPKLRPGREAEIARRLVGRHQGHFPAPSLVRIWREVINAFTCMQGPFSIALSGAPEDRRIRELARDHFGGTPERVIVEDIGAAIRAVAAGDATLAVLPWGERAWEWFADWVNAPEPALRICFGLPFVREHSDVGTAAVAVGRVESEPTDNDRSVLFVTGPDDADSQSIEAMVRELGFVPLLCVALGGAAAARISSGIWILEISGRPDADAMERISDAFLARMMVATQIGAYAEPILLSSEERADR